MNKFIAWHVPENDNKIIINYPTSGGVVTCLITNNGPGAVTIESENSDIGTVEAGDSFVVRVANLKLKTAASSGGATGLLTVLP